jgi:hypothetical protein
VTEDRQKLSRKRGKSIDESDFAELRSATVENGRGRDDVQTPVGAETLGAPSCPSAIHSREGGMSMKSGERLCGTQERHRRERSGARRVKKNEKGPLLRLRCLDALDLPRLVARPSVPDARDVAPSKPRRDLQEVSARY